MNSHIVPKAYPADTLVERMQYLRTVWQSHEQTKANLQQVEASPTNPQEAEILDRLGAVEDIQTAVKITSNSLQKVLSLFSESELQQAKGQKLISTDEFKQWLVIKRTAALERKQRQEERER